MRNIQTKHISASNLMQFMFCEGWFVIIFIAFYLIYNSFFIVVGWSGTNLQSTRQATFAGPLGLDDVDIVAVEVIQTEYWVRRERLACSANATKGSPKAKDGIR